MVGNSYLKQHRCPADRNTPVSSEWVPSPAFLIPEASSKYIDSKQPEIWF